MAETWLVAVLSLLLALGILVIPMLVLMRDYRRGMSDPGYDGTDG